MDGIAERAQRLAHLLGVSDDHDDGSIWIDVLARHAGHVFDGDGLDILAIAIEVVGRQVVQLHVQKAASDVAGRLDGGRKDAGQIVLGVLQFPRLDVAGADAPQLVEHFGHRLAGHLVAHGRADHERAGQSPEGER